jgi:hypothetical protein
MVVEQKTGALKGNAKGQESADRAMTKQPHAIILAFPTSCPRSQEGSTRIVLKAATLKDVLVDVVVVVVVVSQPFRNHGSSFGRDYLLSLVEKQFHCFGFAARARMRSIFSSF